MSVEQGDRMLVMLALLIRRVEALEREQQPHRPAARIGRGGHQAKQPLGTRARARTAGHCADVSARPRTASGAKPGKESHRK